jgi:hypothetical protein
MKVLFVLFAALIFQGCDFSDHWSRAPERYACTAEQMSKVEAETIFCKGETNYNSEYCYGTAITRNCVRKAQP